MINHFIEPTVLDIRDMLLEDPKCIDDKLTGMCHTAACMIGIRIMEESVHFSGMSMLHEISATSVHGELAHKPSIPSEEWCNEHTMSIVTIDEIDIWVDPTCGQFKDIIPDIPDYYISTKKPKWFYPDDNNPRWRGIGCLINDHLQLRYKGHKIGIIEYLQYIVWGSISDAIRKIFHR